MEDLRPTIEIVLPDCGAKVVMYSFIRGGDYREIQKSLLNAVLVDINDATESHDMKDAKIDKLSGAVTLEQEEMALRYIVKEVITAEGERVDDAMAFIYNSSIEDNEFVYAKANEITRKSRLSAESKKKLQKTQ